MDDIDKKILNILQNNFRISYKVLGKKVKMAASSVHNRVQKMLDEGVIKKEDTIVNDAYIINLMGSKTIHVDSSNRIIVSIDRSTTDALLRTDSNRMPSDEWVHIALTCDTTLLQSPSRKNAAPS